MKPIRSVLAVTGLLSLLFSVESKTLLKQEPFQSKTTRQSEKINNYTIVQPQLWDTVFSSEDAGHPLQMTVTIKEFTIQLELNQRLSTGNLISRHYSESGQPITTKGYENCYYQGRVSGHPDWRATMSTCSGLRGSFGNRGVRDKFFHIEPLDHNQAKLDSPHVLYLDSQLPAINKNCGTPHDFDVPGSIQETPLDLENLRLKRQSLSETRIVEWAVVNDFRQFQLQGSVGETVARALEIANYVDMLYRNEYNIRVVITYIETWNTGDRIITTNPDADILLDNFRDYDLSVHRDSAMLITGIDIAGDTIGIASLRAMCSSTRSFGVTQDFSSVAGTGATAAHELGHIFNMEHDDGRSCASSCTDPSNRCIMSARSGFPPPTEWTTCSRTDLLTGFSQFGLDRCLFNEPDPEAIVGDPVCGNGIRERGETCDCGTAAECRDPCCNATSCQLNEGAQCFTGACCSNCQFRPYGTFCRTSAHECDIAEYCSGEDSTCPDDVGLQNGVPCANNQSHCFSGSCVTYDDQCQLFFNTNKGTDNCFSRNTVGNQFGNCGHSVSTQQYIPCQPGDEMCGLLFCQAGTFNDINGVNPFVITVEAFDENRILRTCRGSVLPATSDMTNPGLVADGTTCGDGMVCHLTRCVPLSSLNIPPCPVGANGLTCSGNGVCNSDNVCSCNVGFAGALCTLPVDIPQGDGGAVAGAVIGTLLALILIAALIVGGVLLGIFLSKKNRKNSSPKAYSPQGTSRSSTEKTTSVSVVGASRSNVRPSAPPPRPNDYNRGPPPRPSAPPRPSQGPTRGPPPRPTNQPGNRSYKPPAPPSQPASRPPPPSTKPPPKPVKNEVPNKSRRPPPSTKPPPKPVKSPKPVVADKPVIAPKPGARKPMVPPKP